MKRYEIVLCKTGRGLLTLEALAACAKIHPGVVERFVDYGLIEPVEWLGSQPLFDATAIARLRMIERLRRDLGVNLSGIGMILELLDRLRTLRHENEWLRGQL